MYCGVCSVWGAGCGVCSVGCEVCSVECVCVYCGVSVECVG